MYLNEQNALCQLQPFTTKYFCYNLQVDDENQKVSINLDQVYFWRDNRVIIDDGHSFWRNRSSIINLKDDFAEDCLWTPNLEIKDLRSISVIKPTPSSANGSPFKTILSKLGTLYVESRNLHITVPCAMEFADYPFDQQVHF